MLGFVIGLLVGGLAGVIIMCLCTAAKQENEKCQIRTSNFVRFGDTILKRFMVSLLVERRVRKCRQ